MLRWNQIARLMVIAVLVSTGLAAPLAAQRPPVHYQNRASMPPGAIGSWQLRRGGPLPGYFQPVKVYSPEGAMVAPAVEGRFEAPARMLQAGLLIGQVYRLRVTNIPLHEGEELFPTIEVIDRTYPPHGQAGRFPIPIELSQLDLDLALSGHFVTRVIYVENPRNALPVAQGNKRQEWVEVEPGQDPLHTADTLGRPVAILRIGGRLPENPVNPSNEFLYGSPQLLIPQPPAQPAPAGPAVDDQQVRPVGYQRSASQADYSRPLHVLRPPFTRSPGGRP